MLNDDNLAKGAETEPLAAAYGVLNLKMSVIARCNRRLGATVQQERDRLQACNRQVRR